MIRVLFSMGIAALVALALSSDVRAQGCLGCGTLPSPQASAQCLPAPQCAAPVYCETGCDLGCKMGGCLDGLKCKLGGLGCGFKGLCSGIGGKMGGCFDGLKCKLSGLGHGLKCGGGCATVTTCAPCTMPSPQGVIPSGQYVSDMPTGQYAAPVASFPSGQ